MQLRRARIVAAALATAALGLPSVWAPAALERALGGVAHAEDRADVTTTYYQEQRRGGLGGLTVIHPQADLSVDLGETTTVSAGYSADVVSGATPAVYQVDAVSAATTFEDVRHEGHLSLGFAGSRSRLSLTAGTAVERDYASLIIGGSGSVDLPGKNTTFALSYTHNFDQVCDKENGLLTPLERLALEGSDPCEKQAILVEDTPGMTVWRSLDIDTLQATLTQNLSPRAVLQVGAFGQVLRGFQSNPYRRVRIGDLLPQESVPSNRGRAALMLRVNRFIPAVRGALHVMGRGYSDTWGVDGVAAEMGYSQYFGRSLLVRFRGRFSYQQAATFYKDAFYYETESTAGAFFTGDRELGQVSNILGGVKLAYVKEAEEGQAVWGVFDSLQLNLKGEAMLMEEFATGSVEDNPFGIDNQFLTSDQLLDAVIIQLGLLLSY
ncbi:DUF3570 domain-containing protein [Haliangium ochraceum]|uniref:DUF3570 domain-containing protein n=1 Tax=Haliangium ochraceum (strain DSM 14365 / JCM 11303 / SMP-2) TaxID=502025 RepID=D0LJ91_HALO1|nr:DUF3570 domain-containing protein [Haliangium ochraceum]ACY14938.1 hypothetical protein Hoch_2401 [Haliangium ochraceum DSM 14365]